ncbi:MAG: sulfotransferase family protein [Betaproteobacteria bacterium 13_1_20CM_3_63_8]|nr:MAG: sulfotransferase family protein [Betaproteobacteria bacterium 13_1_20CM_3_63_8]
MPSLRNFYKLLDPEIRAKNLRAMGFALRGRYWDLARSRAADPVFVVGCSRSGTTVTYETIAMSPRLLSFGHEIPEFWDSLWGPHHNRWESEAAGAEHALPAHRDAAQRYFFQRLGLGRVLDKTCINVMRVPYLHALFPNARFVYIHRDGRDNVSSLMDGWLHDGHFALGKLLGPFPCPVAIDGGAFHEWSFFLPPGWRDYNDAPLEEVCALQWLTANRFALDASRQIPPEQWIRLRYEDIFDRPLPMFREVFERLKLPFDDAIERRCATLDTRPTSIVKGAPKKEKWKAQHAAKIERILPRIRPMMVELGYDIDA